MEILIRSNEASQPDPFLLWDSIWDPAKGFADWEIAGNAPQNSGGLLAANALQTAVTLCLFTDAELPKTHPLAYLVTDGDFRGYWGDGIDVRTDLGEGPLGSFLWVLKRAPLTLSIANYAKQFAADALACLQSQGAVSKIVTSTTISGQTLFLTVTLYGSDGTQVFNQQFAIVWQQITAAA
jgi:phage gp46-like protein